MVADESAILVTGMDPAVEKDPRMVVTAAMAKRTRVVPQ